MGACRPGERRVPHRGLRDEIERYREAPIRTQQDLDIGCLLPSDVRFFSDTAGPPPGFAASIVRGKGYDLADSAVVFNFGERLQRLVAESVELDLTEPWHRPGLASVRPSAPRVVPLG